MATFIDPPMGWNSWDCFGTTVTEAEVLANATFLRDHLASFGWNTVVVDIAWYDPTARSHGYNEDAPIVLDAWGRQLPAVNRFPSAATGGFTALAERVHAMGLRFGIHVMRGIPRRAVELDLPILGTEWTASQVADRTRVCAWNPDNFGLDHRHPGAQAYYDGQVAQFAQWGVDFIKADDMQAPFYSDEIAAYALAVQRSGRDITLSLSPGASLSTRHIGVLRENAGMWRISDDLWDRWEDIHAQFARLARWAPLQGAGGWADADMLPVGRIGVRAERGEPRDSLLTADEQKSLLTLWTMARSPLMLGADLPSSSQETVGLLQRDAFREVLDASTENAEVVREPVGDGEVIAWSAASTDSDAGYVAVFWTGSADRDVELPVSSMLGLRSPTAYAVTDLWDESPQEHLPSGVPIRLTVPSHGARWIRLDPVGGPVAG